MKVKVLSEINEASEQLFLFEFIVLKFYHFTFEEGVYDPMYDYLAGLTRFN